MGNMDPEAMGMAPLIPVMVRWRGGEHWKPGGSCYGAPEGAKWGHSWRGDCGTKS